MTTTTKTAAEIATELEAVRKALDAIALDLHLLAIDAMNAGHNDLARQINSEAHDAAYRAYRACDDAAYNARRIK